MRKAFTYLVVLALCLYFNNLSAQISQGGIPPSFKAMNKSILKALEPVKMPYVNVQALRTEDVYNDQIKDQPWRFGEDLFVNYNPENSGVWDFLEDGSRIWRLKISSKGALSINLTFNKYKLPKGAQLFIYSADKTKIIGAFTDYNNQEDGYFATTLIKGESVVIEYYEPRNVEFPGELNLWRITHGYRGFQEFEKAFGSSGSCNVNAACPQGDPYRDQIRSVAHIILGGSLCTGALINNTNNNETPLFLSANHCYSNPGTVVFWFNWQSETCSNPGSSPAYNSMSGATDKAKLEASDFWLMELNQTPPEEYNVYYSGWNRTTASSISGTVFCAHHPGGDIKKISWSTSGVSASASGGSPGSGTDHWRVASWSDGTTTEGGSSGSPLFDPNGRIIGQLHGGLAACDSLYPDWYGNLGYSWTGGGTNSTRLSNWLDPAGTGAITMDGHDPGLGKFAIDGGISDISEPVISYTDTVEIIPTIRIRNYGTDILSVADVSYIFDIEDTLHFSWTGDLAMGDQENVIFSAIKPEFGEHSIEARISVIDDEYSRNDSLVKYFEIFNCNEIELPIEEGFNQAEVPGCWNIEYLSGDIPNITFVPNGTYPPSSPSEGTHLVQFNSYDCEEGSEMRLSSPRFSTDSMADLSIAFDWYHDNDYPSRLDRMYLQYSLDSLNWNPVDSFMRANASLSGWNTKNIPMTGEMMNQDTIYVGFLFHSEYGNNCYLDNLTINGIDTTVPYINFYANPLVTDMDSIVTFSDSSKYGSFSSWEWDFGEGAVPETATGQGPHEVYYTLSGYKTITLLVDGVYSKAKENLVRIKSNLVSPQFLSAKIIGGKDVQLGWDHDTLFIDGFESGDFSLWNEVIQGPGTTDPVGGKAYWHVQGDSIQYIYEGNYGALVVWGYDIDTWIVTPRISISERTIVSFIWTSSYEWHVNPNDNGDLFVVSSSDNGNTWDEPIWTFGDIGEWDSWTWYETVIDLSEINDDSINIAFNVLADDNADIALDNVFIGDEYNKNINFGTHTVSNSSVSGEKSKSLTRLDETRKITENSDKATLINYSVYRDNTKIGETAVNTYTDLSVPVGSHTYYVVANYNDPPGVSEPSNEVQITITDIKPVIKGNNIILYPNPSTGIFNVVLERDFKVSVMNIQGVVIEKLDVNNQTKSIDLSKHPQGLYILHFEDKESIYTKKVIVK